MKILLISLLLLYGDIANAKVFKCIDSNGLTSYSDIQCGSQEGQISRSKKANPPISPLKNELELNISSVWARVDKGAGYYFYHIVFSTYLMMSIICYVAYSRDKKSAKANQRRTPERTLHIYELLGGWPGGFVAQRMLRHKNRKFSYQLSFWFIAALHMAGWFDYLFLNQFILHRVIALISSSA